MADPRRERKVVTVFFADLVGFTSRAEQLDPEDVEAILQPYHERLRTRARAPRRYGREVHRRCGDGAVRRAGGARRRSRAGVRAALAIRQYAGEEGIELRIGITTGEALVRLSAKPEQGETVATGDVVNTAARLQAAAPVNGVLADETTYRATRQSVDYREVESVEAKGKADPIPVWEAREARARYGIDVTHHARTKLVGRERELSVLRDAFGRARHERIPQLVTLVAVPGMGKSRLVHELWRIVDADPELITWRQGRCLAYGDGVAFWALAEVVKAQAGILERDSEARRRRSRVAVSDASTTRATPAGSSRTLAPSLDSRVRRRSEVTVVARPSRRGAGIWRRSPSAGRWCSCSRISTGPTRVCSTSSPTWSTG